MKERIDLFLVEKGYFSSREQAHRAIMAGEVCVNGRRIEKPSQVVVEPAEVTLANQGPVYVSRGAHKLAKAITTFQMDLVDRICLDAGASTGGFTDYLLQNGAAKVYAVDVGYGQLAWKLRQDPRVVVVERQNIRYYNLPENEPIPSLITADLSFISLELVLPKFKALIGAGGEMVTLIKPQFEAGKDKVGKKGVVRDPQIHRDILERLIRNAPQSGWNLAEITFSPLLGPEGNIEYLGHWLLTPSDKIPQVDVVVAAAWEELKGSL